MAVIRREQLENAQPGADIPKVLRSQKDFHPSPYRRGAWESLDSHQVDMPFAPIEVNVIEGEAEATDEMFENFGDEHREHAALPSAATGLPSQATIELVEAARKAGYEEGLAAGESVGLEKGRAEAQALQAQTRESVEQFHAQVREQLQQFYTEVEQESVRLALNVARRILSATADAKPEYIIEVIRKALDSLGATKAVRIRVSPEDFEFITVVGLPTDLSPTELGIEYVADEKVRSGCVVDSQFGEIDLQLEHMWEQVRESIFEVVKA